MSALSKCYSVLVAKIRCFHTFSTLETIYDITVYVSTTLTHSTIVHCIWLEYTQWTLGTLAVLKRMEREVATIISSSLERAYGLETTHSLRCIPDRVSYASRIHSHLLNVRTIFWILSGVNKHVLDEGRLTISLSKTWISSSEFPNLHRSTCRTN